MVDALVTFAVIALSGILWKLRGVCGWPFTVLFSLVQVYILWPVGPWAWLMFIWIMLGEPTGWKPKHILDGDWLSAAWHGFRIGGIGAIAVPLSTWIHLRFGEPMFPNNQKPFHLPFWDEPKYLLDWRGAWNEVYMGAIFSLTLALIIEAI